MTRARQTLAAVAKRAGVSVATVSRVLNEHMQVKDATRERVKRALAELRYDPDAQFAPFVERGSPMVGLLISASMMALGLNRSVYLTQLGAIREEVEARGYGLFVGTFSGDPSSGLVGDRVIRDRQIRGAVLARVRNEEELGLVRASELPVVVLNRPLGGPGVHAVTVDNRAAGARAARHLLELGHRRLGVIAGPADVYSAAERLRGYEDAVREAGLSPDALVAVRTDLVEEQGRVALGRLLDLSPAPTGILCVNDYLALAAVEEATRRGVAVPGDLSIVGFDDVEAARYVTPALTTIKMPWDGMARLAARILLESVHDRDVERAAVEMRTELVVRASTGPAPEPAATAAGEAKSGRRRRKTSSGGRAA